MRWPWVARGELEAVRDERDRLREREEHLLAKIDEFADHLVRLIRVNNGRPEQPHEPKGDGRRAEPVPESILELVRGFEGKQTQFRLLKQARARHAAGQPWEVIRDELEHEIAENMVG